jgi:signal transduction histidine kinase
MAEQRGAEEESLPPADLLTALDRVGDGFLVLDKDWRVRFANAAALRLLGRDGEDLVGKDIWAEFPTAVGSTFELKYQESLATQRIVEFEEYFALLDAWFSIRAYPSLGGVAIAFRDITHLHDLLAERQALLDRILDAEDRERARIAADIHDDTAQALVAIALRLDLLRAQLGPQPASASALLGELDKLVRSATTGLRILLFGLEPTDPAAPIEQSIRTHAAHLFNGSSIHWTVHSDGGPELPPAERSQVVRIAKEALNNAHAHARASEVTVTIRGDDAELEVVIADDGVASDPTTFISAPGHRGLATMQDRAAVVGGVCVLEPSTPQGCTVRVTVPRVR